MSQPTDLSVGREGLGASGGSDQRCERVRKSRRGGGGAGLTGKRARGPWAESRCEEPRRRGEFARTERPLNPGLRVELAAWGRSLTLVGGAGRGRDRRLTRPKAAAAAAGRGCGLGGGGGGGARRQRVASWAVGGLEGAVEEEEEVSCLGWELRWPREAGSAAPPSRRPPRGAARRGVPSGAAAARSGGGGGRSRGRASRAHARPPPLPGCLEGPRRRFSPHGAGNRQSPGRH